MAYPASDGVVIFHIIMSTKNMKKTTAGTLTESPVRGVIPWILLCAGSLVTSHFVQTVSFFYIIVNVSLYSLFRFFFIGMDRDARIGNDPEISKRGILSSGLFF